MKRLCVFTLYDEKGGSSQYRAFIFRETFEKYFDVKWFCFWNNNYATIYANNKRKYIFKIVLQYFVASIKRWYQLNFTAPKSDVIFIQKGCIPKCHSAFLRRVKKKGVRVVFDIDDALYTSKGDNSDIIAEMSDVVVCGNKFLLKHYSQINYKCIVLPTVENTKNYIPYWHDTFQNKIIGWIGSAASIHSLSVIVSSINRLIEKHPEVEFHIICNDDYGFCKKTKNSKLIIWNKDTYVENLSKITVGVMPLEETEFNEGKCGFKLIQYLNMKKPVVGSGIGVNCDIIRGNGFIASSQDEWTASLEELLYNAKTYEECVGHIENVFFEQYHFEKVAKKLIKILDG